MKVWSEQTTIPTTDLASMAWGDNPRRIHIRNKERLTQSLERFGVVEPIIVNKRTSLLVGGHQRVKIALENDIPEMLVTYVDLSAEDAEELALILNNEKAQGEWDEGKLAGIIRSLASRDHTLITSAGFSREDVNRIILKSQAAATVIADNIEEKRIAQQVSGIDPESRPRLNADQQRQTQERHDQLESSKAPGLYSPNIMSDEITEPFDNITLRMSFGERLTVYKAINQFQRDHGIASKSTALVKMIAAGLGIEEPKAQ